MTLPIARQNRVGEPQPAVPPVRFLVVDDNGDARFLLSQTLQRTFPHAHVIDCATGGEAFRYLEELTVSLVVSHHTSDAEALVLVRELRRRAPGLPIIVLSAANRRAEALVAGADAFLPFDEWLMVGNQAAVMLKRAVPSGR